MPATAQPQTVTGKTPAEVLNYLADFSAEIAANEPGDSITAINSVVCKGTPATLAVASSGINQAGTGVMIRLTSGSPGVTYSVVVNISLASSQTMERTFMVPVVAVRG